MVNHNEIDGVTYVGITGELDDKTAPTIRTTLDEIIDATSSRKVVFDMSGLDFMDSTGIGVLIGRYKKMTIRNISGFIACPSRVVDKVLNLSGIYKLMPKI